MKDSRRRRAIAVALIWHCFATKSESSAIPFSVATPRIGIVRVGKSKSMSQEKAFALLEKQLQRSLENSIETPLHVKALPLSLHSQQLQEESERLRLEKLTHRFQEAPSEQGVTQLTSLMQGLSGNVKALPSLQNAWVAIAKFHWTAERMSEVTPILKRAALIHPDGLIEEGNVSQFDDSQDWDDSLRETPWQQKVRETLHLVRPACHVLLRGEAGGVILVNGFRFGHRREFYLPAGGNYLFQMVSPGFERWEKSVSCERQSRREFYVSLRPESKVALNPTLDLNQLVRRENVSSLLLAEAYLDGFRFYYYHPGSLLVEVPLQKPVKVSEVLENPRAPFPVTSANWQALVANTLKKGMLSSPTLASSGVVMTDAGTNNTFGERDWEGSLLGEVTPSARQWYNNWKVWAIAGSVVTGLLVGYFAVRSNEVKTQGSPVGIQIQLP